jgi:hypothetical protein
MINFENRLKALKDRRQGSRERMLYASMESRDAEIAFSRGADPRKKETFEDLNETAGVKYAIGAMAQVDSASTEVSISEGNRVADNLIKQLITKNIKVEKKLQGSVALDIHIKGHSDVDMLVVLINPLQAESPYIDPTKYSSASDTRPFVEIVSELRSFSEQILTSSYPKAVVNTSNNKSIAMEGGSLQRKIDIVPSSWYDTLNYQKTYQIHHRGIKIYHKSDNDLLLNYPFRHIKNVNDKDNRYNGNLKCVIRLMKNMVADMPDDKKRIVKELSSYDLTAIAFHMDDSLNIPTNMRLGLVDKLRSHLVLLYADATYRNSLYVPDVTRKIFDKEEKIKALEILAMECISLSDAIYKLIAPLYAIETYDSTVILSKRL